MPDYRYLFYCLLWVWCGSNALRAAEPARSPEGIYKAEAVAASPTFTASGLVWWKDKLLIAERGGNKLLAFTPPEKFETFAELKAPIGVAVDPKGNLVVTHRDEVPKISRYKSDGTSKVLATEEIGTPHFITVHKSGTLMWTGFPDGGTRSLKPAGKPESHQPRIGHAYGLCLSPKQDFLFVSSKLPDVAHRAVWRFPVEADGTLGKGEEFFKVRDLVLKLDKLPPAKDGADSLLGWVGRLQGLTIDALGNFYVAGAESHTSGEAIAVVEPTGKKVIAMILGVPRNISCMAFGGKDGRTLFITGAGNYKLHQVELPVGGLGLPNGK